MNTSKRGLDLIKKFEGLHLEAYLDPIQIPTIGWGTIIIDGKPVKLGMRITEQRAQELLEKDVDKFERFVHDLITVPLNQNQFDALVSFTYNLGPGNLEKSTLRRVLNSGKYAAAQAQFLRWNRAGGRVMKGLTRRRLDEAALFGPLTRDQLIDAFDLVV